MWKNKLHRCEACGSHFIISSGEVNELAHQGIRRLPSRCHYCRRQEQDLLYAQARQHPELLFRYRCGICLRIFVSVRDLTFSSPDYCACPECMPHSIPFYTDYDRQLNKDLDYPR